MDTKAFLLLNRRTQSYHEIERTHSRYKGMTEAEYLSNPEVIAAAEIDLDIFRRRLHAFDHNKGPRVGDYVIGYCGSLTRFTYDWGPDIQTGGGGGSYYLGRSGGHGYSGGLDGAVDKTMLIDTGKTKAGQSWIFHKDWAEAHKDVYYEHYYRVFSLKQPDTEAELKALPFQFRIASITESFYNELIVKHKAVKINSIISHVTATDLTLFWYGSSFYAGYVKAKDMETAFSKFIDTLHKNLQKS